MDVMFFYTFMVNICPLELILALILGLFGLIFCLTKKMANFCFKNLLEGICSMKCQKQSLRRACGGLLGLLGSPEGLS